MLKVTNSRCCVLGVILAFMIINLLGCQESQRCESWETKDTIKLLNQLQTTNAASSPINPLALPIGAGLAGLVAVLESLRRVEKGKRQHAEHKLNNNNNNS